MTPKGKNPRAFGITGGIGAGKSEVGKILNSLGYPVISFDALAAELSAPQGVAFQPILETFGTSDRAQLRDRVFSNPTERAKMEAILHPLIISLAPGRLAEQLLRSAAPFAFFEAALLFECNCNSFLAGCIVVTAPEELRIARAMQRNPEIPRSIFESITRIQLSENERVAKADFLIDNSGPQAELPGKVGRVLEALRASSQS